MADLLLHSLAEHRETILGTLGIAGARRIVEIGTEDGHMTRALLEHVDACDGELVCVDPSPSAEAEALLASHPRARLERGRSLEVLPRLAAADAYLVDGDHNWHTVRNESEIVWARTRAAGRPFLALYHDVGWPWARRDLYYDPAGIPPAFRQPHTFDHGVAPDEPGVVAGGFRGEGRWACALTEGGPRNGVLTAIEDFVAGREERFRWALVPAVFGLGVLFESDAPWADALTRGLLPLHLHPLLDRLERNRIELYLRVLDWQDRHRAEAA